MTLIFGDSYTSGENNSNISFADYLGDNVIKSGVSGTCFGEYSIYPVETASLVYRLEMYVDKIRQADTILLEFGINDITAVSLGYVKYNRVFLDFVKCIDFIKQNNSSAKIIFLSLGDEDAVCSMAQLQSRYIKEDYLKWWNRTFYPQAWAGGYLSLVEDVTNAVDEVISMIPDNSFFQSYLSDDNMHPTDEGYRLIAEHISSQVS